MLQFIRRLIGQLRAWDAHWTDKRPLLYPMVKMTLIFLVLQVLVQVMYLVSDKGSDALPDKPVHPPNYHSSLFPDDHAPLRVIHNGSYKRLYMLLHSTNVAMVMHYAPWCHHSARLAKTFLDVARNQTEVLFIAINCWSPSGDCRQSEGAGMFPRITVHRKHISNRIGYFADMSYHSLLSYSYKLVRPLTYLTSYKQVNEILKSQEILVIGFFNFTNDHMPAAYKQYYLASLLALQTDESRSLIPAQLMSVITDGNLASNLSLPRPPSISLIGAHRRIIQVLPMEDIHNHDLIYQWIVTNCTSQKIVDEFIPMGNISHLLTTPVSLLFLPLSGKPQDTRVTNTLSKYISAAHYHNKAASAHSCLHLGHIKQFVCRSHTHPSVSLPLCHRNPSHFCPKFNPFYNYMYLASTTKFCQDFIDSYFTGGWPPPCTHVRTSFYYVDSKKYWALAQSLGVVERKEAEHFLIFVDLKNHLQFHYSIDPETITSYQFNAMFEEILIGQASPLYRSGCGRNCSSSDVTAREFNSIITEPHQNLFMNQREEEGVVVLVHYVSWCAACAHLWPVVHALNETYHTHITVLRINGDHNDLPICHTPRYYPSIALYKQPNSLPVWYPDNVSFTVENLITFITEHLPRLQYKEIVRDETDVEKWAGQWEEMGWKLWEISERERLLLERKNIKLGEEVSLLREKITVLEQQKNRAQTSDSYTDSLQLESLINRVAKAILNSDGGTAVKSDDADDDNSHTPHSHTSRSNDNEEHWTCNGQHCHDDSNSIY